MSEGLNRAFMYGESVFTTMRVENGHLRDWNYHFERLKAGVEFIYGPFTDGLETTMLLKNRLEERAEFEGDGIVRLTVYLEQGRGLRREGFLSVNDLKIHASLTPVDPTYDEKVFKMRTCVAPTRPQWWPSFLKAGSYLETILAQKQFLKPEDDDLLFLSPSDTVYESSIANIFIVRHNKVYTAPAGPHVLAGVMRRKVIESGNHIFESVEESETTIDQLFKADGIFGTNSVRGPFLIDRIDDYNIQFSKDFLHKFDLLRRRVLA